MRTMTLVGTEPVPIEVHAAVEVADRTGVTFAGNLNGEQARNFRAKLDTLLQPKHVLCKYGDENWLRGCRTTISFEPSDVPIGAETEAAVLAAVYQQLPFGVGPWAEDFFIVGEFSVTGDAQPLRNALGYALRAYKEKRQLAIPEESLDEISVLGRPAYTIQDVEDLQQLVGTAESIRSSLTGSWEIERSPDMRSIFEREAPPRQRKVSPPKCFDLAHTKGQKAGKRALEIAAAGGHNLLFVGPPGEGKTRLAQSLPGIMAPLSGLEAAEVTHIRRMKGLVDVDEGLIGAAPFEEINRNTTTAALLGGGSTEPKPGVITLAHHGVLYLDELHLVPRSMAEALRSPLQDGEVVIQRARWSARMPARFVFVTSTNPCPCGWLGHPTHPCRCTPAQVRRYQAKLSGPLLDRIPLIVPVPPLDNEDYVKPPDCEPSKAVRKRVISARQVAAKRKHRCNAEIPPERLRDVVDLSRGGMDREVEVAEEKGLSTRSRDHLLRVSRTIADLAGSEKTQASHVGEAAEYIDREKLFIPKGRGR